MDQLSLFDFPEESTIFRAPIATIPQDKWDAWWLKLLCEPRNDWEDKEDFDLPAKGQAQQKQEAIPGLG